MSTLKMVLLVAKTLKTTIQKKSPKCARKIPVPQFRYSQTIFFFALLSNRAYEPEAFDLTKLYFETLFEILVPSQLELYTLHSN